MSGLDSASLNMENRWKIDGFAWMFVCVSLNLVTCVFFYLINTPAAVRLATLVLESTLHVLSQMNNFSVCKSGSLRVYVGPPASTTRRSVKRHFTVFAFRNQIAIL